MIPAPKPPSLIQQSTQMARDGYGVEDLMVRLGLPEYAAKYFVFGPPKPKEKSR